MTTRYRQDTAEIDIALDTDNNDHQHGEAVEAVLTQSVQMAGGNLPAEPKAEETDQRIEGIVIGRLVKAETGESARPIVEFPGFPDLGHLPAIATVSLRQEDEGRDVALTFEAGDPQKPILLGIIHGPEEHRLKIPEGDLDGHEDITVERDGERLVLSAEKEIVLQCGKSSITLTRAGKVIIRGTYVLSRSSGVNRIKGGSVQLN